MMRHMVKHITVTLQHKAGQIQMAQKEYLALLYLDLFPFIIFIIKEIPMPTPSSNFTVTDLRKLH